MIRLADQNVAIVERNGADLDPDMSGGHGKEGNGDGVEAGPCHLSYFHGSSF
jgi:hypothetical protein